MIGAWQAIAKATDAEYRKFLTACRSAEQTQFDCLMDILKTNASSKFGRRHDFKSIRSIEAYRKRIPVCTYESLSNEMGAQTRGEPQLCAEPVQFFEETGGSSGGAKLVPYTNGALLAIQRAIEPWLADLIQHRPGITRGASYWSVSPVPSVERKTSDGTPIGSSSELAFLREDLQPAFAETLTLPHAAMAARSIDEWRLHTLSSLVMQENLRLISIWSPAFLTTLMTALVVQKQALLALVCDAAATRLSAAVGDGQLDTQALWPNLDTISCWTHGPAASQARDLARLFPQAVQQPKGLLATEGVVSIPLFAADMPVLAVRSGFFEFQNDQDRFLLAHELKTGHSYRVIMTTYSGFYRYDLGDTVVAHGRFRDVPTLEFIGRQGIVSDLCGEKLTDAFVSRCLAGITGFATVAPRNRGYCLYIDSSAYGEEAMTGLASDIEKRLAANPQYAYARRIGQLDPLKVIAVERPADKVLQRNAALGQRLGNIKPAALSLDSELHQRLGAESI